MPTEEAVAPSDAAGDNAPEVTASATTATAEAAPKRRKGSARATAKGAASSNKSGAKPQHNHPPYGSMIKAALLASEDKKGSSRAAILKYIMQNYEVGENASLVNSHLRMGLKRGVTSGALKQVKGTGASGSFRLADAKTEPAKAVKKPMAKKTAAAGDVKMAAATPKKSTRTKSMKKVSAYFARVFLVCRGFCDCNALMVSVPSPL
ncbi:unnamed protein product [Gongylonema pulchrum]|uniref:H15 domain-containing protein n=1 Tax=Gongylonema pulchrum TaxID=637853 RepID=A0A183ETE8_9BILA|nr:unnamed protein product [Gongylonema pulchrum]